MPSKYQGLGSFVVVYVDESVFNSTEGYFYEEVGVSNSSGIFFSLSTVYILKIVFVDHYKEKSIYYYCIRV